MVRGCLLLLAIGSAGFAQAQSTPVRPPYVGHAVLTHRNGKLIIHVNNSRPVEQALAGLRREYGLTLDYEEGEADDPARVTGLVKDRRWIGGSYTIKVNEPASSSFADSKKFIADVLSQFRDHSPQRFIEIIGANDRITVSPSNPSERILDTPITLKSKDRTIDQTIKAILAAVSQKVYKPFGQGGIADTGTLIGHVTIGSATPIAARILLAQALDSLPYRRYWIQGWDPREDTYAILIDGVVRTEKTMSGAVREIPIRK